MKSDESFTHRLSSDDARIVDWLVEHGFDADAIAQLPAAEQARAHGVLRYLNTLDTYTVEPPDDTLTDATLARIAQYEERRTADFQLAGAGPRRRSFRLADLIGVAAMLMLSAAVFLPIASQVRAKSLETACASNLRAVGAGLTSYAQFNKDSMPAMAGLGSMFGDFNTYRHSKNLNTLATSGYCSAHTLNCPGCARSVPCYAYRVPTDGTPFLLQSPNRMVVVADANPIIALRIDGLRVPSGMLISKNHSERGQNMLFNDGAVEWHTSPVLTDAPTKRGDNIWMPRGQDGREQADLRVRPTNPEDNFVAQ